MGVSAQHSTWQNMPPGTKKYCQVCAQSGCQSRLKLYQINFNEAIQLCENKSCSFPLEASSENPSIHQRDISLVPPLKRKSSSTRSVKSVVSTPFGTPTVLSPVSFASSKAPKTQSCDSGLFVNSILSDSLVNATVTNSVNVKPQELDLEDLLNIGAFDEPLKENCAVNVFQEPLPLKAQNPPTDLTSDLQAECADFSRKYAANTPKNLLRNTFEDIFDIDENTNVFPFDSDLSNTVSVDNGLSFCPLTNGFNLEKNFHKFGKQFDNLANSNINHALCSQDSESALDEEVRSIFEYNPQLFEKNNLWSNTVKDKMMAPIKDEGAGESVEMEPVSQGNLQDENDVQQNSEAQAPSDGNLLAGTCQSFSGESVQQGCNDLKEAGEQMNQEVSSQNADEPENICSTTETAADVPVDGASSRITEQPPEEIMDYEVNSDPLPSIESEEHLVSSSQGGEHIESVAVSEGCVTELPLQTNEQIEQSEDLPPAADEVVSKEVAEGMEVEQDLADVVSQTDNIIETEEIVAKVPAEAIEQVENITSSEGVNCYSSETSENQFEEVCSSGDTPATHAEQEAINEIGTSEQANTCLTEECVTESQPDPVEVPLVLKDSCDTGDPVRPVDQPEEVNTSSNGSEERDCVSSNQNDANATENVTMESQENIPPVDGNCEENLLSRIDTSNCVSEIQVNEVQYEQVEVMKEENEHMSKAQDGLTTSEVESVDHSNIVNQEIQQEATEQDVANSQGVEDLAARSIEHSLLEQQAPEVYTEAIVTSEVVQGELQGDQIQPEYKSDVVGQDEIIQENQEVVTQSGVDLENSYIDSTGQVCGDNITDVNRDEVVLDSNPTCMVTQSGNVEANDNTAVVTQDEVALVSDPTYMVAESGDIVTSDHTAAATQGDVVLDSNQTHMDTQSSNLEEIVETVRTEASVTSSHVTESIVSDASTGEVTPVNDIVRTAFLSTGEALDEENPTEAEGVISGHTYIVDGMQTTLTTADPQAFVSHQQNIVYTTSESQISGVSEAYQYATVNEMGQAVDAQPFQTIENVPIFEHEVSNVTQTYNAISLGEQTVPVDSVVDHVNMNIDQHGMIQQPDVNQTSVVGMEVDNSQGVLMSIPEQTGDLMQNQIYTVPMTSAEPVTQTIDFSGMNQVVTQQTDYSSQDDQLPDLTPVEQSVTLTSPGGSTTTTQGIVLQPGQQLIDGAVYTTIPQTALSNMAVTSQNGVFTIASPTASSAATNHEAASVLQTPILISGSSTSVPDQTASSQPGVESTASIQGTIANSQALAMVKDPLGLSEEEQAKILAELENDIGPIPLLDKHCLNLFVQWQNRDAMCWLDVVMIVLCNSPTIQKLFTDEENTMALKDSVLSTLLKAYYQAQHLMQKLTAKVHSDYKENLAKNTAAAEAKAGDSKPGDGAHESPSVSSSVAAAGEPISSASNTSKAEPSKPKTTTVVNKISLKSMQDYFKAMDILDTMREKIWDVLQPRLQCERGKNDSPLFALPLLVREPAMLKEKFKIKFKYTFDCDQCAYHQEDDHSKLLPSFPEVPPDFNMIQPSFIRNCFQCKASGKRMKMTFSSIPDMLCLHFKEGLPHSRLNELCFTFGGETYMVTAVIQYKNNPDHFVAWIRNGTGDQWMECDDLKSTLCQFVTQEPAIPPNQIHIIMWEKNVQPSAARDLEETSACNILQSCLRVLQPDVMPGTSVVLPGKEALAQGLKRKAELNQNTVKYILSQNQGGKLPGIITLPAGANAAGLQGMKIMSLPPASSASGLLANVAGLSSGCSTGQVSQGNTSSFKPVILQSKNRPTILSSMVTSLTPQQSTATSLGQATSMRVVKSGNKIVYMPAVSTVTGSQIVSGKMISEDSNPVKPISCKPQNIDGQIVQSTSKGPNLKYIELDRSQISDRAHINTGGKSKTYVVGADGILQEVIKDAPPPSTSPVKKNVINIQAAPTQAPPAPSVTGAPKIIVKKKNERGEIVQTILTDLDCKQNSELMKAIESLKNGDTATGGAVIQQLIKGKEKSLTQSVIPPSPVTTYETRKVVSIKPNTPMQQPGTKYVQLGENMIQLQSSAIRPPSRGRGRGRALARGGRKKRPDFRPVPIVTSSQMHIDASSPSPSEPQCIVISPPGQSGQTKQTGPQVVKVLTGSSKSGSPIILSQSSAQTLTSSDKGTMSLQSVVEPQTTPHTVTTLQGTKITTLLASQMGQGSVLKKNVLTLDPSSFPSAEKTSPVKYILPNSPGQPTSPTKTPGSSIIKIQKSTSKGVTSLIKSTPSSTFNSPTTVSVSSPTKGISTVKVMSSGHNVGSPLGQSPSHAPEISSPSMGSPQTETVVLSDTDRPKSPSKSPKYSPVISVQGANADTAMIAKAIQTLVDKGVPIQQIQNQAFLSKLISTLKASSSQSITTPVARSLIQHTPKSSNVSASQSISDQSSGVTVSASATETVSSSSVSQTITSPDRSKVVIGTSGISPMKPATSVIHIKQNENTSVTDDVSSDKKKPNIIVKPGQSYLAAVKPYLKLGKSKEKPKEFDEYKLKSDVLKDKLVTDGGFTSIDMIKTKEKDRVISNSTSVVVPQPIVPPKADIDVAKEEPMEELVLPEEAPLKTIPVTPSKQVKDQSNIVVIESPGRVKKANPLHVIADAAVSRLPVPESTDDSLPKIQAPGRGRGRGRGRPPKKLPTVLSPQEIITVQESLEPQTKPVQKRSFMDAFDTPESENPSKQRKIETVVLENLEEKGISTITTPENFVKPKGRTRKQPVIPTPDSVVDDVQKPHSESPYVTPKGRSRPRKQSVEIEVEVKTPKSRGRPSSISPSLKTVGRPRKSSVDKIPTPEPKPTAQKKTPAGAQTKISTGPLEDVTVTPRGRGRPPKNIVSPDVVKNTPKQTFTKEVVTETPKSKSELTKEKADTPKETDISELFNSPEVKYVGKYKILPIERPNTRRRKPESPVTSVEPEEILTEENKTPSSGKRRGRPPKTPAKRPKID